MASAGALLSDTASARRGAVTETLPRAANAAIVPAAEVTQAEVTQAGARWLHGEPTLIDILTDQTVDALMERDDVDPDDLVLFLQDVRAALTARRVAGWLAHASGQALHVHHGDFALQSRHVPGLRRD
jgi:hypothetical protein